MTKKEGKNNTIKKREVLAVFSVVLSFLFFCQIIKANSPDAPLPADPGANIGIVMQGVDLTNPNLPRVMWTTYGNTPAYYWVQVSEYQDFSIKVVDTGQQAGNPQSYTISSGLTAGHSYYVRVSVRDNYSWTPWACQSGSFVYNPNYPPTASNLSSYADYCVSSSLRVFSWNYLDPDNDPQSAYQIQIAENPSFSPIIFDSGKVYSSSYSYTASSLSLNKTYYWRLMVWDARGMSSSSWYTGPSFSTPSHAYPSADFTWFPDLPTIGQEVLFMDRSRAYGGASIAGWSWTIPDANYVAPSTSANQNPIVKFTSEGDKIIRLQATDSDGFSCSIQKTVRANLPLPCWKEISPH